MLECSFASFSTAGGTPFVNPFRVIWDSRRFAATPDCGVGFPWISLDSLARIETYQWVTRVFSRRFFLAVLSSRKNRRNGGPPFRTRNGSWGNFLHFLIFSKKLPALIALSVGMARFR